MIERIFVRRYIKIQHQTAPLLREREDYLRHLLQLGRKTASLQNIATILLHVVRVMDFSALRCVNETEIKEAGNRWALEYEPHRMQRGNKSSAARFVYTALPAISLPALMGFSLLCGKLEGRGRYLISTSEPQEIAVTQTAWPSHSSRALPFPPGDYLMYPYGQDALVLPEFKDLTIENGYLINGKLDPSLTATERAEKTTPGLTYVTMRVSASPIKATTSSKS